MHVIEAILNLARTTKFSEKDVDERLVAVLLHLATHAPSAGETKPWHFIVVKDEEKKRLLYEASLKQTIILDSKVCIVIAADLEKVKLKYPQKGEVYATQDCSHAAMLIFLSCVALGLGCNFVRAFDEEGVKKALDMPEYLKPLIIVTVGYPSEEPEPIKKIPFENVSWEDSFGKSFSVESKDMLAFIEKIFGGRKGVAGTEEGRQPFLEKILRYFKGRE